MSESKLLLAVLLAAVAGCGNATDEPEPDQPFVALGTGHVQYEPLADGDDVLIVYGMQGGYHFFGSARMSGLEPGDGSDLTDPNNPTTSFRVTRDGQRLDTNIASYVQGYHPIPGTELTEMTPRVVVLDIESDSELDGATVEFTITVTDVFGVEATDTKTLVAVPHPDNPQLER